MGRRGTSEEVKRSCGCAFPEGPKGTGETGGALFRPSQLRDRQAAAFLQLHTALFPQAPRPPPHSLMGQAGSQRQTSWPANIFLHLSSLNIYKTSLFNIIVSDQPCCQGGWEPVRFPWGKPHPGPRLLRELIPQDPSDSNIQGHYLERLPFDHERE